jgi:hypothetical protein
MRARMLNAAVYPALALLLVACNDQPLPGEMLGTYKVSAESQTNTCGSGLQAPSPWTFSVQLSESGTTLYWSWMDGSPPLSSPLGANAHASLTTTLSGNVDGTADGGFGPCTMERADDVELTLGPGSPPASFSATITYSFDTQQGSSCSDQLSSSGGMYDTLPCKLAYSATGSRD